MISNSIDTLITPNEVRRFSPVGEHDSTVYRESFIINKEEKLFNLHFGWEFYQALIADKINYKSLSTYKGDYNPNTSYLAGDSVQFIDQIFVAQSNTTGVDPNNQSVWSYGDKFANADYNYIWDRYLAFILACNVLYTSVVYSALQMEAQGLVKKKGDNFDGASLKEMQTYKKDLYNDIQDIIYNMDLYLTRNKDKFPLYLPFLREDYECGKKKDRKKYPNYGFNVGGSPYSYKPTAEELDDKDYE